MSSRLLENGQWAALKFSLHVKLFVLEFNLKKAHQLLNAVNNTATTASNLSALLSNTAMSSYSTKKPKRCLMRTRTHFFLQVPFMSPISGKLGCRIITNFKSGVEQRGFLVSTGAMRSYRVGRWLLADESFTSERNAGRVRVESILNGTRDSLFRFSVAFRVSRVWRIRARLYSIEWRE